MRFLAAAGLAGACLATSPLFAADLFSSAPPPMDAPMVDTELGSNWYIRGDVGYAQTTQSTVLTRPTMFPTSYQGGYLDPTNTWVNTVVFNGAPTGGPNGNDAFSRGNFKDTTSPTFSLGFGYRVNDWLRLEADYQFSKGPGLAAQGQLQCAGPSGAVFNYSYTGPMDLIGTQHAVGYQYNPQSCTGFLNATQFNNTGLVSAYIDLGHWSLFTPYIGGGAGLNASTISGSLNYANSVTGQAYNGPTYLGSAPNVIVQATATPDQAGRTVYVPLTDANGNTPQGLFMLQNWNRHFDSTKYTLAAQLAAGVGVQISQSATLDIGARVTTLDLASGMKNLQKSVNIGVRYNIN
ncbi:MAG: hypothetical protein KGM15_00885 [Pseudomonadota bacterium]|nr:hypothetical protein [Pseudomonadota bacterium]